MNQHKLAVLGNPIRHSRSPEIHQMFAQQAGIELFYGKVEVPEGDFQQVATRLIEEGYRGFNVTLPCKGDAFRYANRCSDPAVKSEAVNTISLEDNLILGDNTDGAGLVRDMTGNLGWNVGGKRILVLGAGGAVRGVLPALLKTDPVSIHLLNRTFTRAQDIVLRMADERLQAVTEQSLLQDYDLIINGTSAGLLGGELLLPVSALCPGTRVYDMVYGVEPSLFCQWCVEVSGCEISDGLGMLVEQAALSFHRWFATEVRTPEVIATLRNQL